MNNQDTDLITILLNKFPEVIDKKDELAFKNLNVFLTLNLYNEKYIRENNLSIHFKNSITGKNSIACTPFSKDKNSIQFVPYNDVHVNEAIAFSICNSYFTCIRINNEGMFIEKQDLHAHNLKTEYYDKISLEEIICNYIKTEYSYNDAERMINGYYFQNNTIRLTWILQFMEYSFDDPSDIIAKKYNINPDFLVEADSYDDLGQKLLVKFSKNNIPLDSYIVEFPTPINLYAKYFSFMKEQGFYSDNSILTGVRKAKYPPWIKSC